MQRPVVRCRNMPGRSVAPRFTSSRTAGCIDIVTADALISYGTHGKLKLIVRLLGITLTKHSCHLTRNVYPEKRSNCTSHDKLLVLVSSLEISSNCMKTLGCCCALVKRGVKPTQRLLLYNCDCSTDVEAQSTESGCLVTCAK